MTSHPVGVLTLFEFFEIVVAPAQVPRLVGRGVGLEARLDDEAAVNR